MTKLAAASLLTCCASLPWQPLGAQAAPTASAAAAAPARQASEVALLALPWPDPGGFEPAVREALLQGGAKVAAASADHEAWGELGLLFAAHGLPAAAEVCFANAAALAPDDFRWPHLRGLALIEDHRLEEAATAFAEAYSRRPYYPALLRRARALQELGRFDDAKLLLSIAAAHSADDPALLALQGEQAALEDDHAAAIDLLSRALARAPGATRLHYPLALSYRARGDAAAANRHFALAGRVGIVPLDPLADAVRARRVGATAWDLEGQRALQAGDAAAAAAAFRKALDARPGDLLLLDRLRAAEAATAREE